MNGARGLLIATAAAFIVGCSVGLIGGILFIRFAAPGPHGGFRAGGMPGGPPPYFAGRPRGRDGRSHEERMLPFLEREIGLTPDQRERIVAQIDRARDQHVAVRESMKVWLERELTPAQRERWKQVEERMGLPRHGPGSGARRRHDRR